MVKNPSANARDAGGKDSISGLGRSLEEEMATHSSILVTVHGVAKSWMRLSD